MKIRKAVIPAAGFGTRFLPLTKSMPKEMLPIINKPVIHYVVEEAVRSGIKDILIITATGKRAIEDYFDHNADLEQHLGKNNKNKELNEINIFADDVYIHFIRQKEQKGLGHAVSLAKKFVGNEPFVVLLGDDIIKSKKHATKQMMDVFEEKQATIIGVEEVPKERIEKYGVIDGEKLKENLYLIKSLVEKPKLKDAPSNIGIIGRYILMPQIFECLEKIKPGAGGELQLTDALVLLQKTQEMYAFVFDGKRYDTGNPEGWLKTNIEYAMDDDVLRKKLKLKELLE